MTFKSRYGGILLSVLSTVLVKAVISCAVTAKPEPELFVDDVISGLLFSEFRSVWVWV